MDTDRRVTSLGAVLPNVIDGKKAIEIFTSSVLAKAGTNYSSMKREDLAAVKTVKWFKSCIWGMIIVLPTDHLNLQWLFQQENPDGMTL